MSGILGENAFSMNGMLDGSKEFDVKEEKIQKEEST